MTDQIITSSGRRYPFVGGEVRIVDGGGAYLRELSTMFPKEFARALKSTGYTLRKDLQTDIYAGGPREGRWSPLSEIHAKRIIDDHKGRPRIPRTHPMGNLVRAIGYKYDSGSNSVRVGWLSHSAAKRGAELQQGFHTSVSTKMRRFFWALGLHAPTRTVRTPKRDLFDTVMRARERAIMHFVESKVLASVNKQQSRFAWAA